MNHVSEQVPNKVRPCQPGDVLLCRRMACGARYEIIVGGPVPNEIAVSLELRVDLPARSDGKLQAAWSHRDFEVLGSKLSDIWGEYDEALRARSEYQYLSGNNLQSMVQVLRARGDEALELAQRLHYEYVRIQESKQQRERLLGEIYAQWLVEDRN